MNQHSIGWLMCLMLALMLTISGPTRAAEDNRVVGTSEAQQQQAQREITQPGNNAPFWREVRGRDTVGGTVGVTTVTGRETGVLIQSEGQTWREVRNGPLTLFAGIALAVVFLGILLFYWIKGPIVLHEPKTGRLIVRFGAWERLIHWTTAITFLILAFTGLAILFGRHVLIPIVGHDIFGWIAIGAKWSHNLVGPLFIVCSILLFITFLRDNFWRAEDWVWIRRAGGLLTQGRNEPASHRFNAGEKAWFWGGVSLLGIVVGLSGLVLDFPNFDQTRQTMQLANIIHLVGATLFMIGALGHIYMGTIGMRGAYTAMRTGVVDETWAKEHHSLWYDDIRSGKIPADGVAPARPISTSHLQESKP